MQTKWWWLGRSVCAATVCVSLVSSASAAITIETVLVGNPGNPADSTGYGAVDYTYNIGKYEVTAGQYTAFLNAVAATDIYELYSVFQTDSVYGCGITRAGSWGNYTYSVDPAFANRPVNYVNIGDAMRFANWLHNGQPTGEQVKGITETGAYSLNGAVTVAEVQAAVRNADWRWAVTSENEWYKAAYHKNDGATGNYYLFPTGSDTIPGIDMDDMSGNNANYNEAFSIDNPYFTTLVGAFQNSGSPYGTFDQGGNVSEWNEAVIDSYFRGWRGGSFLFSYDSMQSDYRYDYAVPQVEFHHLGFRVSAIPEPTTMCLLALGGLAIMRRWRTGYPTG